MEVMLQHGNKGYPCYHDNPHDLQTEAQPAGHGTTCELRPLIQVKVT